MSYLDWAYVHLKPSAEKVHFWSLGIFLWTCSSSHTHGWTLETPLCPPLPPHYNSSSVWEEKQWHCLLAQTHTQWSQVPKFCVSSNITTVSYSACEGPGSFLKSTSSPLDMSLFTDTHLNTGDSALSSSSSSFRIIFSLRGKTMTLTVSSNTHNEPKFSVSSNITKSTLLHSVPVVTVTWDSCWLVIFHDV